MMYILNMLFLFIWIVALVYLIYKSLKVKQMRIEEVLIVVSLIITFIVEMYINIIKNGGGAIIENECIIILQCIGCFVDITIAILILKRDYKKQKFNHL